MLRGRFNRWLGVAFLCAAVPWSARSAGTPSGGMTLLVVPARYSVLQVAFDILHREPVYLVAYQGDARSESPLIHVWSGQEWLPVQATDYEEGNFLQVAPARAILVGDDDLLPPRMSRIAAWCPAQERVRRLDTGGLVNDFGKLFQFSSGDWKWFARRYNLKLQVLNEDQLQKSWYDYPHPELKPKREQPVRPSLQSTTAEPPAPQTPVEEPVVQETPKDETMGEPKTETVEVEPAPDVVQTTPLPSASVKIDPLPAEIVEPVVVEEKTDVAPPVPEAPPVPADP